MSTVVLPRAAARGLSGSAPWVVRGAVAAAGFLPVAALALHLTGVAPLVELAGLVPVAVLTVTLLLAPRPRLARAAGLGLVAGIVATVPYDALRLGLTAAGWFPGDGIPNIGRGLQLQPYWMSGYVWRFLGDGGGMGLSFAVLGLRGIRSGAAFGAFVAFCLFATLWVAPGAQEGLFPLTPSTVVGAGLGHLVYGSVLGALVARWRA